MSDAAESEAESLEDKKDIHLSFVSCSEGGEVYWHEGRDEFCYLPSAEKDRRNNEVNHE